MNLTEKVKTKDKLDFMDIATTIVIVVGPMFTQYSSITSVILLPELLLIPLLLVHFLKYRTINTMNMGKYFQYFLVCTILSILNLIIGSKADFLVSVNAILRHIFYALVITSVGSRKFKIDFAAKTVLVIAALNSIYGFLQYFAYNFLGRVLPWYFSFLPVKYGTNLIENSDYYFGEFGYRFSGLFSEPAHFSQYLSIALIILLFYRSKNFQISRIVKVILSLMFISSLLLNGSGTGFAMMVFIIILYFVNTEKSTLQNTMMKFVLLIFGVVFAYVIIKSDMLSSGLNRIMSVSELSSGNIRIFRPFFIFSSLQELSKLIGVGYANYSEYVVNSSLVTTYELINRSAWTNTVGYILVGSGIIGLAFYIRFLHQIIKKTKYFFRYLSIVLVLFAFFTEVPLSFQFITIMCFINCGSLINTVNNNNEVEKC